MSLLSCASFSWLVVLHFFWVNFKTYYSDKNTCFSFNCFLYKITGKMFSFFFNNMKYFTIFNIDFIDICGEKLSKDLNGFRAIESIARMSWNQSIYKKINKWIVLEFWSFLTLIRLGIFRVVVFLGGGREGGGPFYLFESMMVARKLLIKFPLPNNLHKSFCRTGY